MSFEIALMPATSSHRTDVIALDPVVLVRLERTVNAPPRAFDQRLHVLASIGCEKQRILLIAVFETGEFIVDECREEERTVRAEGLPQKPEHRSRVVRIQMGEHREKPDEVEALRRRQRLERRKVDPARVVHRVVHVPMVKSKSRVLRGGGFVYGDESP